jgi:hypothetical protein
MRIFTRGAILALVVAVIFTGPSASWAAGGPGGGGGGGAGGGTAQAAGALYGDLYVIERDGNGVPLTRPVTYVDSETGANVTVSCQQPLAKNCGLLPLWGECGKSSLPPGVLNLPSCTFDAAVYDPCSVYSGDAPYSYTDQLQAVSFGRESVSRAPATVIDKSYGEALKSINLALPNQCTKIDGVTKDSRAIKLDPAGRITLCLASDTDPVTYAWKTIDAPLENLGLYRAAMTTGCFGPVTDNIVGEEGVRITVITELSETAKGYLNSTATGLGHLVCTGVLPNPVTKADMLSAAVFLAAGADKSSPVTLDEIINLNNYVGVNTWTYTTVRKVKTLTINYFQFKVTNGPGGWFGYTNGVDACKPDTPDTIVSLLTTSDNGVSFMPRPVSVFNDDINGVDLTTAAVTVCRAGFPLQELDEQSILVNLVCDAAEGTSPNPVYSSNNILGCGGANWFTQASEDARKTIWYLHNWRLPVVAY